MRRALPGSLQCSRTLPRPCLAPETSIAAQRSFRRLHLTADTVFCLLFVPLCHSLLAVPPLALCPVTMASLRRSSATLLLLLAAARQTTGQRHVPITTNRVYSWDARDIGGVPGPRGPSAPGGSACDPGASQPLGFACVHMAMLSDDMLAAARYGRTWPIPRLLPARVA